MTVFYDESIGVKNSKVFDAVIDWTWKRLNLNGDIDITYSLDNLTNDEQGDLRGYCLCDPEDTQEFEIFICKTMQRTDIKTNPNVCTQCLCCQLICSLINTGCFNPLAANIVIEQNQISFTNECRKCDRCLKYCTSGAITRI